MVDTTPDIIKSVVSRTGPPGNAGNQTFSGAGPPADPYPGAYDGDWYLDTTTGILYELSGPVSPTGGSSAIAALSARIAALEALVAPPTKAIVAGRYYGPVDSAVGWTTFSTLAVGVNAVNAGAFFWPADAVVANARLNVVAAGASGTTMRLAIYEFGPDGLPAAKVMDLGAADVTATGDRITPTVGLTLPRGTYWLAGAANAGVSIQCINTSGVPGMSSVLGHSATSGTTSRSAFTRSPALASGFTTMPTPFGTPSVSSLIPAFWVVAG